MNWASGLRHYSPRSYKGSCLLHLLCLWMGDFCMFWPGNISQTRIQAMFSIIFLLFLNGSELISVITWWISTHVLHYVDEWLSILVICGRINLRKEFHSRLGMTSRPKFLAAGARKVRGGFAVEIWQQWKHIHEKNERTLQPKRRKKEYPPFSYFQFYLPKIFRHFPSVANFLNFHDWWQLGGHFYDRRHRRGSCCRRVTTSERF